MRLRGRRFEVDRNEGKLLGVCAGIANHSGVDVTLVRAAVVLLALVGSLTWTAVAYAVVALIGHRRRDPAPHLASLAASPEEARDRMRTLDLRMQAIETHVTSSNSRLAREIEDLR